MNIFQPKHGKSAKRFFLEMQVFDPLRSLVPNQETWSAAYQHIFPIWQIDLAIRRPGIWGDVAELRPKR